MISLKVILFFTFASSAIALFFGPPAKVRMKPEQTNVNFQKKNILISRSADQTETVVDSDELLARDVLNKKIKIE